MPAPYTGSKGCVSVCDQPAGLPAPLSKRAFRVRMSLASARGTGSPVAATGRLQQEGRSAVT